MKVRGYRIELGEIENRLMKREEIKEAVLTSLEVFSGELQLAAYIVFKEESMLACMNSSGAARMPVASPRSTMAMVARLRP